MESSDNIAKRQRIMLDMELELEYIVWLIEKEFYKNNQCVIGEDGKEDICNARKNLPCNCLTGLGVNYWGYVVNNCQNMNVKNTFEMKNHVCCILTAYREKRILPFIAAENDNAEYWLSDKICVRDEVSHDRIYIARKSDAAGSVSEQKLRFENKISEDLPICDFLSCFIVAVRTQPVEKESAVLFAIMLFFFPNRTMELVLKYLNDSGTDENSKAYIRNFIREYDVFLERLSFGNNHGFFFRFYQLFEKLTGIYIGEWIEDVIDKQENKKFWREALYGAYNRNVEERKRRNSPFKKILRP